MSFFDTTPVGRILNRFSKDVDVLESAIPHSLKHFLSTGFSVAQVVIVVSIATPFFLLLFIPIAALYLVLQRLFIPTSRQLKRLESTKRSPVISHFAETLQGVCPLQHTFCELLTVTLALDVPFSYFLQDSHSKRRHGHCVYRYIVQNRGILESLYYEYLYLAICVGRTTIVAFGAQAEFMAESAARSDENNVYSFASVASNRWVQFYMDVVGSAILLSAAVLAVGSKTAGISPSVVGISVAYALQACITHLPAHQTHLMCAANLHARRLHH